MTVDIQGRHGEFEPGKAQYLTGCFLYEPIETQNLGNLGGLACHGALMVHTRIVHTHSSGS